MTNLTEAIASTNQPMTTFKALEALVHETVGIKLFTLMEVDHERGVARRNYSNMPEAYATSGEKPIQDNLWTAHVHDRQEIFVANSIKDISEVFPDHALIKSLGCESCMNIPIVVNGHLIGTLNCLHAEGHFTPERVAAAESLKQAGALAFLLDNYQARGAN
jgi:GAF domain-containing protein